MRKPKIFVVGSGGFLGSIFCELLTTEGIEFDRFERSSSLSFFSSPNESRENLTSQISKSKPDVVVNLANYFSRGFEYRDLGSTLDANVLMPIALSELARQKKFRLIQLGSFWQLEHFSSNPLYSSMYLYSKKLVSSAIHEALEGHAQFVELLIPDTFGRNDNRDKLIPQARRSKLSGECVSVKNPFALLNFCSAEGVSRVILELAIANHVSNRKILLAPSLQITVRELLKYLGVCEAFSENEASQFDRQAALDFNEINDGLQVIYVDEANPLEDLKLVFDARS